MLENRFDFVNNCKVRIEAPSGEVLELSNVFVSRAASFGNETGTICICVDDKSHLIALNDKPEKLD